MLCKLNRLKLILHGSRLKILFCICHWIRHTQRMMWNDTQQRLDEQFAIEYMVALIVQILQVDDESRQTTFHFLDNEHFWYEWTISIELRETHKTKVQSGVFRTETLECLFKIEHLIDIMPEKTTHSSIKEKNQNDTCLYIATEVLHQTKNNIYMIEAHWRKYLARIMQGHWTHHTHLHFEMKNTLIEHRNFFDIYHKRYLKIRFEQKKKFGHI